MVEHQLPKLRVASSSLVSRSQEKNVLEAGSRLPAAAPISSGRRREFEPRFPLNDDQIVLIFLN